MPASTGKTGRQIYIKIGGTEVINVLSIGFEGRDGEEIDFTHLRSDGGYREFQQGFKDPGTINLTLQFDPTSATHNAAVGGLEGLLNSGATTTWEIVMDDAGFPASYTGNGFIKSFNTNYTTDSAIEATCSIRVSGAAVLG